MAPRFDAENLTVDLSVGDLLESVISRSLGFANRGGYERLWLGQAIHSRYQEEALGADPSYRREVTVSTVLIHRGWEVHLRGRIDGLRRDPDGSLVVEEIKSVRRGATLAAGVREVYERQAMLYAWMLSRKGEEHGTVRAELVLIEIGTENLDRSPLNRKLDAVEADLKRRLNALIRAFEGQRMSVDRRREAAARLEFPHDGLRPGQQEILQSVDTALAQEDHLLVEAPTGIGKTVAALLPALRYALEHDKRLFVLTAKTLQQEMAIRVLGLLNAQDEFHTLQLRAKAKMCSNDQLICHEEYCPYARDYYSKLQRSQVIARLLDESGSLLPDRIYELAGGDEVCPFEVSLEIAGKAQVIVCDYNYAFAPHIALRDFDADNSLRDTILVVDEIHNLVDRGRGYYSPTLSCGQARAAGERSTLQGDPVHRAIARLCSDLADLIEETVVDALEDQHAQVLAAEWPLPEERIWALRPRFDEAFIDYLEYRKETSSFVADDPFVDLYFGFLRFVDGLARSQKEGSQGREFSHCVERRDGDFELRILCKDPSQFLGQVINRTHSTIGLSATLTPLDFYRDLLGFDPERLHSVSLPSPFPPKHRSVVIDASVSTLWKKRPENYPLIAESLSAFATNVPGNCLALFPSYRFLEEVAQRLRIENRRVLVQRPRGSDRERQEMLEVLRSALTGDVLLLAVAGGVFAEGVDYPGDMLKAVAVVGPCLPAVTLEQELLKIYFDERFERGFEYAFVVPGMTRVVQAAGRLIRSSEDKGVIALLGRRFLAAPYRRHLPEDWVPEQGIEALEGNPGRTAALFFESC